MEASRCTDESLIHAKALPTLPIHLHSLSIPDAEPHVYNCVFLWQVESPLQPGALAQAVRAVFHHHEALRLRFQQTTTGWQTRIVEDLVEPFTLIDLSSLEPVLQHSTIEFLIEELQSRFDLTRGPLARAVYFSLGTEGRLLLMAHHFLLDGYSSNILLEDLLNAYIQSCQGVVPQLPAPITSFSAYAQRLQDVACSQEVLKELHYWVNRRRMQIPALPVDYPEGLSAITVKDCIALHLSEEETDALIQLSQAKVSIRDLLLCALFKTYISWTGNGKMLIEYIQHGRDTTIGGCDLTRTVGWLNTFAPVLLEIEQFSGLRELTLSIKKQLQLMPENGIGYALLRYLGKENVQKLFCNLPMPQLYLNYRGRLASEEANDTLLLHPAPEHFRQAESTKRRERIHIWIAGHIFDDQLSITWHYQTNLYKRATMQGLVDTFVQTLQTLPEQFHINTKP